MNTIDSKIYENPTVNIAILGCISSGKSTLMNSLFAETYSNMTMMKTTMCPQVYNTNKSLKKDIKKIMKIKEENEKINNSHTNATDKEVHYDVPSMPDIFSDTVNGGLVEYSIYDIPGLNDSDSKLTFVNYIKNNFYKFDIVIFNIDINSALNSTDESDILTLIVSCIKEIKTKYGKEVRLFVICNKCDELSLQDDTLVGSPDIERMFQQVERKIKEICTGFVSNIPIIKYSAAYTYMYRSINGNCLPENIDKTYIDKIGIDNMGKVSWNRVSKNKTYVELWELVKGYLNDNSEDALIISGFKSLCDGLGKGLIHPYIYDIMYSKIYLNTNIEDFLGKYTFIKSMNKKFKAPYGFKTTYGDKILEEILNEYFKKFLDVKYNFKTIDTTNYKLALEYELILLSLAKCELNISKINNYEKEIVSRIEDYDNKMFDYKIRMIETNNFTNIEILEEIINDIFKYSTDDKTSIESIRKRCIGNFINKVEDKDFQRLLEFLKKKGFSDLELYEISDKKFSFEGVDDTNYNRLNNIYRNILTWFKTSVKDKASKKDAIHESTNRIKKLNNAQGNYEINKLKNIITFNKTSLIVMLDNIFATHPSPITEIFEPSIILKINSLIAIDDYDSIIKYLEDNKVPKNKLDEMYAEKIARTINNSGDNMYKAIAKNYLLKIFIDFGDSLFNYLSCSINIQSGTGTFVYPISTDAGLGDFKYTEKFVEFYFKDKKN